MRYLTIAADYSVSCLRDDCEGGVEPEILKLREDLCHDLRTWNDKYRVIIPLDMEQRAAPDTVALIDRFDGEGLELAARVREAV